MIKPLIASVFVAIAILSAAYVALAMATPAHAAQICGNASWYGPAHHGRVTASGAVFNQWAMTAAMASRSHLGEVWRVKYNGKSVVVKITDTGGFAKYGRIIDLSRGAFRKLADEGKGVLPVCLEKL